MKGKNLAVKIPVTYISILIIFMLVINLVLRYNTQGFSEWHGIIYSLGFFIVNPVSSFIFAFLLIIPFPLLIWAIAKKRRDLIIGCSFSAAISVIILILIGTM